MFTSNSRKPASPRIASSATLALNSAVNRLRVFMLDRPFRWKTHLMPLSRKPAPPHRSERAKQARLTDVLTRIVNSHPNSQIGDLLRLGSTSTSSSSTPWPEDTVLLCTYHSQILSDEHVVASKSRCIGQDILLVDFSRGDDQLIIE